MTHGHLIRGLVTAAAAGALVSAGIVPAGMATAAAATPLPGTVSTIVGGPGGPDPAAIVSMAPCGVKFANKALYIAAGVAVDRVSQGNGWLTPVAGTGVPLGALPASGVPASAANLAQTCSVATDSAGNLLLADVHYVRVVAGKTGTFYGQKMTRGRIYTLGSSSSYDYNHAVDVEVDPAGNLVVADAGAESSHTKQELDSVIHVVAERTGTFYGQKMTRGKMYVVAGTTYGYAPGNGVPATRVDLGDTLGTVRLDSAGNLIVAASGGNGMGGPLGAGPAVPPAVRVVAGRTGIYYGQRMKAGYIYTIAGGRTGVPAKDGVPATKSALDSAAAVALDRVGNVVIADGDRVRVVAEKAGTFYGRKMTAGDIYAIAGSGDGSGFSGSGGPAAKAVFGAIGVVVDSAGNILVADQRDYRVLVIAARSGAYYGLELQAGYLYSVAGSGQYQDSGDGGPATSAELVPSGVAEDRSADLVAVTDGSTFTNVVRVVPGRTGTFFGRRMVAGFIYTIAGNRTRGYAGDGGPGIKASLLSPSGVTADQAGNVLVADTQNYRVRVVAEKTGTYYGRTMKAGYIYTIAGDGSAAYSGDGSLATAAGLVPTYVTVDQAGNVLVTDDGNGPDFTQNYRVRVVAEKTGTYYGRTMKAGYIYTIAGDGSAAYSGDGSPATAAGLDPWGTAVDSAGNVVIGDMRNNRLRVVAEKTGTYYGQKMTAGDIYTIAGDGKWGTVGDGGPAISAELDGAASPVIDSAGNIAVAGGNDRLLAEKSGTYYGRQMKAGNIYTISDSYLPSLAMSYAGNLLVADGYTNRVLSLER